MLRSRSLEPFELDSDHAVLPQVGLQCRALVCHNIAVTESLQAIDNPSKNGLDGETVARDNALIFIHHWAQ